MFTGFNFKVASALCILSITTACSSKMTASIQAAVDDASSTKSSSQIVTSSSLGNVTLYSDSAGIHLDWKLFTRGWGPNSYGIYRSISGANSFSLVGTKIYDTNQYASYASRVNGTNFLDTTTSGGTSYDYYVIMTEPNGVMTKSNTVSAVPIGAFSVTSIVQDQTGDITFTWSSAAGATNYTILQGTTFGDYPTVIANNVDSPWTVSGIAPGTNYYFSVVATNTTGSSVYSGGTSSANIVGNFTASLNSAVHGHLYLNWTPSTGASNYKVYYGTTSGSYPNVATTSSTSPYDIDLPGLGLFPDTQYYFMVVAEGGILQHNAANEIPVLFSAPTIPTVTATYTNTGSNLSWSVASAGGGSLTYDVYRSVTSGAGYSTIATGLATTTFTDNTCAPGITYYYHVIANNGFFDSPTSLDAFIKAIASVPTPTLGIPAANSISISIPVVTGASNYDLKYGTASGVYSVSYSIGSATPSWNVIGLTAGTTYYFMVYARNAVGGQAVTTPIQVSGKPMSAFTLSAGTMTQNSGTVSWTASTGSTSYTLKYGTVSGTYGTTFSTSATSPTTITGLSPLTNYYVMVSAVNSIGSLNATAELPIMTTDVPPATLTFAGSPYVFTTATTIANKVPTISGGGPVTSCTSNPPLPAGLTLNATNCTLSGTPIAAGIPTIYTISANNTGGSATFPITITVNEVLANFSVSSNIFVLTTGTTNPSLTVTLSVAVSFPITITYSAIASMSNAVSGTDYTALPGTVVIPAGQTTSTIPLSLAAYSGTTASKFLHLILKRADNGVNIGQTHASRNELQNPTAALIQSLAIEGANSVDDHNCAIAVGGALYCWGLNNQGMLGDTTTTNRAARTLIDSGTNYSVISLGGYHTCGITTAGVLKCWGYNAQGQVGMGATGGAYSTPQIINAGTTYSKLGTGLHHACGITTAGVLKCWGYNAFGEVGDNTTVDKNTPTIIDAGTTYSKIYLGEYHSCGLTTANVLKCWGSAGNGSVGDGTTVNKLVPTVIDSGVNYIDVFTGAYHSCGITSANVLKCWGYNVFGQVGDGTAVQKNSPVIIDAGTQYTKGSGGYGHTCGILLVGNALKCWGMNNYYQLGTGNSTNSNVPIYIDSGINYSQISASFYRTCGVTTGTIAKCWGYSAYGATGFGNSPSTLSPLVIDSGVTYSKVSGAINGNSLLGLTTSGTVKNWGTDGSASTTPFAIPHPLNEGLAYSQIANGPAHSCGISTGGVLRCWGDNTYGELGMGSTAAQTTQVIADPGTTYSQVAIGYYFTCGITTAGVLKCWGYNGYGAVGNGSTGGVVTALVTVDAGTTYTQVSAGQISACGITSAGVLKCWGTNSNGQLADGTTTVHYTAAVADAGVSYSKITVSYYGGCGITTANVLKCWGAGSQNQVGDGAGVQRLSPVVIDAGTTYSYQFFGTATGCGVTTAGVLKCWGMNTYGQMGNGTITTSALPVVVDAGTTYSPTGAGNAYNSCAITTAGILKCWGLGSWGGVGDGTMVVSGLPIW